MCVICTSKKFTNFPHRLRYEKAERLDTEIRLHEREKVVERPIYRDNLIERIIEVPVERLIEIPKERVVEKKVERIVDKPIYIENIIEQEV